jgi:hypothetical protein
LRTNEDDSNDRAFLKFDIANVRTFRMPIAIFFCNSQLYNLRHALQWKSFVLENSAIAGVCRQLSSAYLNYSNANSLLTVINVMLARLASRVVEISTGSI